MNLILIFGFLCFIPIIYALFIHSSPVDCQHRINFLKSQFNDLNALVIKINKDTTSLNFNNNQIDFLNKILKPQINLKMTTDKVIYIPQGIIGIDFTLDGDTTMNLYLDKKQIGTLNFKKHVLDVFDQNSILIAHLQNKSITQYLEEVANYSKKVKILATLQIDLLNTTAEFQYTKGMKISVGWQDKIHITLKADVAEVTLLKTSINNSIYNMPIPNMISSSNPLKMHINTPKLFVV
jgi:hypothetical protein